MSGFPSFDGAFERGLRHGHRIPSMRGNAVVRWVVNGATTLFLVWNQRRSARDLATSDGRVDDLGRIGDVPADDRVLLKVSHRFDLPR